MFWLTSTGRDIYVWPKGIKHVKESKTGAIKVGTLPLANDCWIGDLTFDPVTGVYWFTVRGKDSGTGLGDYFYSGGTATDTLREYLIGGYLGTGLSSGFCLSAGFGLSGARWNCVAAD